MELDPCYTGAYYIRGLAFEKWGNIDQSIEDYTTVLQIDPTHVNAAFARGACENKRGNYMKAIEDYNSALKLDSEKSSIMTYKQKLNQNLGMSYVIPNNNGSFMSATKAKRNHKKNNSIDVLNTPNCNKTEADLISTGGTNSFIEGGDQTPSIFNSTIHSVESTPNEKKIDPKSMKFANILQVEINEYKRLKAQADHYHALGFAARKKGTIEGFNEAIELYT